MSDVWYQIRSVDPDSSSLKYTLLLNKQNILQFSTPDTEDVKIPKVLTENSQSTVGVRDPITLMKLGQQYQPFELTVEPDVIDCKVWNRFDNINDKIFDLALMENHCLLEGIPKNCVGIDDGVIGLYLAQKWNYDRASHLDYGHIPFKSNIDISAMTAGFSVVFEFFPMDFVQHASFDPTLAEFSVVSDSSEYFALRYGIDGKLKWFVRDAAITYDSISPVNTILKKALYMAVGTYDPLATPRAKLYLNGGLTTDAFTEAANQPTGADDDIYIGIANTINKGAAHIIPQEFRLYDRALTATEVLNLWYNKRTIGNVFFGRAAVPGYWWLPPTPVPTPDFDTADFDAADFN